jgi:hypothetical protein
MQHGFGGFKKKKKTTTKQGSHILYDGQVLGNNTGFS